MIVKTLHEKGLKSEHAYAAAFVSIGLSFCSWAYFAEGRVPRGGARRPLGNLRRRVGADLLRPGPGAGRAYEAAEEVTVVDFEA